MFRKFAVLLAIFLAGKGITMLDFSKPPPAEIISHARQAVLSSNELTTRCAGPANVTFDEIRTEGYYTIYSYEVSCRNELFNVNVWLSNAEQEQILFDVNAITTEENSI